MLHLTVSSDTPESGAIRQAVDVLRRGGIVAYPTDTFYGLAVDPRRDDAVEGLFALKERNAGEAVPLIAADLDQARAAAVFGPSQVLLADAFWPGPLSIVAPARERLSTLALGGRSTVAVRVPAHPAARALAAAFGFCITATSANRSGEPPASAAHDILTLARRGAAIDLLLDAGALPGGAPSTIVELRADGPALIRAGAIAWERVLKSLE